MKKISDEKKCVICLALVIMMGLLLFYTYADDSGKNQHEGIIRLHVIANSNKVGDQALKLKVRDAVLEYMGKQDELKDVDETREYLEDNLPRLEKIAEGIIASEGYNYTADVQMGVRYIPQKIYGDITFPAGNYEALNITIGSGRGENWWCVLFPPLCLLEEGTESAGSLTPEEIEKLKQQGFLTESGEISESVLNSSGISSGDEILAENQSEKAGGSSENTEDGTKTDSLTDKKTLRLKWKTMEILNGK